MIEFYVPKVNDGFLYFDLGFPQVDKVLPRRSSMFGSKAEVVKKVNQSLDNKAKVIQGKMAQSRSPSPMWKNHLDKIAEVKNTFTVAKVTISDV